MSQPLKIGVLGAGRFGQIHMNVLNSMTEFELTGFYDPSDATADFAMQNNIKRFSTLEQLFENSEVINIVSSTETHFHNAQQAIRLLKPIFIEKPVTIDLHQAKSLQGMATEAGIKVQTGHIERFNPAFLAALNFIENPLYIESHRLAEIGTNKKQPDVLDDLMVHDIDIMLQLVNSPIKKISASAVGIFNGDPDFVNARIEFENGCTASLNASRVAVRKMRITRIFQKDASVSINFLENKTGIIRKNSNNLEPELYFPEVLPSNAIENELRHFHDSVTGGKNPEVNLDHAIRALEVAEKIKDILKLQTNFYSNQAIS
jgi:predicted dehydrogenase